MENNENKIKWSDFIDKKQQRSKLFEVAFTHPSYKGYNPHVETNEILELIGDKVLDLILYHFLFLRYEHTISKKDMDDARQELMSKQGLKIIFDIFNLEKYLIKPPNHFLELSPGVKHNIVEALIGAIYLEEGFEIVFKFVTELIDKGYFVDSSED